jgi:hypothetical protein
MNVVIKNPKEGQVITYSEEKQCFTNMDPPHMQTPVIDLTADEAPYVFIGRSHNKVITEPRQLLPMIHFKKPREPGSEDLHEVFSNDENFSLKESYWSPPKHNDGSIFMVSLAAQVHISHAKNDDVYVAQLEAFDTNRPAFPLDRDAQTVKCIGEGFKDNIILNSPIYLRLSFPLINNFKHEDKDKQDKPIKLSFFLNLRTNGNRKHTYVALENFVIYQIKK